MNNQRIVAVNPGGKPLRYRQMAVERDEEPNVLAFTRQQIANAVAELVPEGRLDALWRKLLVLDDEPVLDEQQRGFCPMRSGCFRPRSIPVS